MLLYLYYIITLCYIVLLTINVTVVYILIDILRSIRNSVESTVEVVISIRSRGSREILTLIRLNI